MRSSSVVLVAMAVLSLDVNGQPGRNTNKEQAKKFLDMYNAEVQIAFFKVVESTWNYNTNITEYNQKRMAQSDLEYYLWRQNMSHMAAEFNVTGFSADFKRQFAVIKNIGTAALQNVTKLKELTDATAEMTNIYNTAHFCLTENECLPLNPDIASKLASSRDEPLLRKLWVGWNDVTGKKMKNLYARFVTLSNEAIQTLGYKDTGAFWRSWYEVGTFVKDVANLFNELRPLYQQLHAYVRRRLKAQYGAQIFPISGQIPAHLLGGMKSAGWSSVSGLMPYPNKSKLDVTDEMVRQNYTAVRMFQEADKFFTSLGLMPMPPEFWNKSMLEKPKDGREVDCVPTAWNFYNGDDFRVSQCTKVTMGYISTIHHEMGHVQYYLQYKHLPVVYRDGANPGFHEAIGDVISLSVETPKHLHKIGLLPGLIEDKESDLNFLMAMALYTISLIPVTYLSDQWRWNVFKGKTTPANYNKAWWALKCDLQGVSPPVRRTTNDFDAGAHYHIANHVPSIRYVLTLFSRYQRRVKKKNRVMSLGLDKCMDSYARSIYTIRYVLTLFSRYQRRVKKKNRVMSFGLDKCMDSYARSIYTIRYFVSLVLQFQIHKALCNVAGHTGPLHQCDIYQSKAAGAMLRKLLRTGSSQVWTKPFKTMTNQTRMSAKPLIEYFQPLMDYLKEINGEDVGWEKNCSTKTFLN